jgi:hypothetical protein
MSLAIAASLLLLLVNVTEESVVALSAVFPSANNATSFVVAELNVFVV